MTVCSENMKRPAKSGRPIFLLKTANKFMHPKQIKDSSYNGPDNNSVSFQFQVPIAHIQQLLDIRSNRQVQSMHRTNPKSSDKPFPNRENPMSKSERQATETNTLTRLEV